MLISEKIVRNGVLDKNRIERLLLRLKSQDQRFSDYISGPEIAVDLSQVTLNIRGIAHFPQVLPNYGLAGFDIEDCKIRENVAIAAPITPPQTSPPPPQPPPKASSHLHHSNLFHPSTQFLYAIIEKAKF